MRPGRVNAGSSADEIDLVLPGLGLRHPQAAPAQPRRDDVRGIEDLIDPVREDPAEERRVVDAVHHDQQLVERQLPSATAHHSAGDSLVHEPLQE
jgi:hypothetical protein